MLKKRIVGMLVIRNGIVVQSSRFKHYLPIGRPEVAIEFLNQWGIDEIIILDITATLEGRTPDFQMIRRVSSFCQVPLTVGGGIHSIDDVIELMRSGADKVAFNSAIFKNPLLLNEAAKKFGQQAVVASIDCSLTKDGYRVFSYANKKTLDMTPAELAHKLQGAGAGEVLINSVDRDGSFLGFDIGLIKDVCESVDIPVICCGGAGKAEHFIEAFEDTSVSAAAAANYFHFTEHSVAIAKSLINKHIQIRHDIDIEYNNSKFDANNRLLKKDEKKLEEMLYIKIEKEII